MALPSTGVITMAQVRTELGRSGVIRLNDATVRTLAGRASGLISMSHLRGKSAITTTHTLTVAVSGVLTGFMLGQGSLSPADYKGISINALNFTNSTTLSLRFSGNRPQNTFVSISIPGSGTFTSASATFTIQGNGVLSNWSWTANKPATWVAGYKAAITIV